MHVHIFFVDIEAKQTVFSVMARWMYPESTFSMLKSKRTFEISTDKKKKNAASQ